MLQVRAAAAQSEARSVAHRARHPGDQPEGDPCYGQYGGDQPHKPARVAAPQRRRPDIGNDCRLQGRAKKPQFAVSLLTSEIVPGGFFGVAEPNIAIGPRGSASATILLRITSPFRRESRSILRVTG